MAGPQKISKANVIKKIFHVWHGSGVFRLRRLGKVIINLLDHTFASL